MTLADFNKGDRVKYIPNHAEGDATHKDCQDGVVSSRNHLFVFVKYFHYMSDGTILPPIFTGDEPYTAAATKVENLIKMNAP